MRRLHPTRNAVRPRRDDQLQFLTDPPLLVRMGEWLLSGVPAVLRQFILGPANIIDLAGEEHVVTKPLRRGRRTKIIVADDLILRRRIEVPARARHDLRHVADLFIRSETPFTSREVFARLVTLPASGAVHPRHSLLLVPRAPIERLLEELGIRPGNVTGIFATHGGGELRVGPARRPLERLATCTAWALPLVIVAGALGYVNATELSARQQVLSELEAAAAGEIIGLRDLLDERDALLAASSRLDLARAGLSSAAPAGWLLTNLRNALPEPVEVVRLELHERDVRLEVRAPDVLGAARTLDQALPGWSATIDGTISADPRGGELATILITEGGSSP